VQEIHNLLCDSMYSACLWCEHASSSKRLAFALSFVEVLIY